MTDPLQRLLLDATEADRATIADALGEYVGIDASSGRIVLLPSYSPLNTRHKILLVLLAVKAAHLLGLRDEERISVQDAVTASGLPRGTVAPKIRSLKEERLVDQGADRAYYVPNAVLQRVAQELMQEE